MRFYSICFWGWAGLRDRSVRFLKRRFGHASYTPLALDLFGIPSFLNFVFKVSIGFRI